MAAASIAIIVVVVAVGVLVIAMTTTSRRRRLRRRFGPEYDRVVSEKQSQRKAQAELASRERRVQGLDIRPLTATARVKYAGEWTAVQERFVDQPNQAVSEAQRLVVAVMTERGYPTEDQDQITADLSVEHANALDHYRTARRISTAAETGATSTEDLRQAMVHYRALFTDLLGPAGEVAPQAAPMTGDTRAESYPASGAEGYPASRAEGYPASRAGGYPASGAEGYPASRAGGYPASGAGGYPASGAEGHPASGVPADELGDEASPPARRR